MGGAHDPGSTATYFGGFRQFWDAWHAVAAVEQEKWRRTVWEVEAVDQSNLCQHAVQGGQFENPSEVGGQECVSYVVPFLPAFLD